MSSSKPTTTNEYAKRFVFGAALLLALLLRRVVLPLLPPSDALGAIHIGSLSIYLLDGLAWIVFFAFILGLYLIAGRIIDKKMK